MTTSNAPGGAFAPPGGGPVQEMRSAAVLLRQRAEAATPGPWRVDGPLYGDDTQRIDYLILGPTGEDGTTPIPLRTWTEHAGQSTQAEADVRYAATVHPLVGLALADLLDRFAAMYETGARVAGEFLVDHAAIQSPVEPQALAFARLINGGEL